MIMFWRMQAWSFSILLNWNYCNLQLQYMRWFVLFSVVHTICHCQSWVMTIIISNSRTRSLSVRLRFQKKQFWYLPVNVPLRVRVWPWQLQEQPNTSEKINCSSLIFGFFFRFWHRFKWTPYWQREAYICSETGEFWTTLKLLCPMRISGIAVVYRVSWYLRRYRYRRSNFR